LIAIILGLSSMLLGLFVSSLLTSNEQAMPSLVGITMFEVVVSGALPLMSNEIIAQVSKIAPSYWATNSFAASVNLIQISRIRDEIELSKWEFSQSTIQLSFSVIALFSVFFVGLATIRIRHKR
jgi:ABC-type transport system involved in multi-copper enzyme maturation permease subunit